MTFFTGLSGYGSGETGLAAQLGAGVNYALSDNTSLDIGYRFKMVNGIDFESSTGGSPFTDGDLRSHTVQVGLRYEF